jgi:hypothetical protein
MLTAALLMFANSLLFSLRLSGGGSFPKPLSAAEEREYLERYAQGDQEARNVLIEHNLRLVAHIIKKAASKRRHLPGKKRPSRRGRISNGSPGGALPGWMPFLPRYDPAGKSAEQNCQHR